MSKSYLLVMMGLLLTLAGCTDTPDTASREYRNAINESIDAMMMVTGEASAKRMTVRIFKGMGDRFKEIDRKWVIIESNRSKKEFIKEVFESDGVHLYLSELQINLDRYSVETIRLRKLYVDIIERKREEFLEQADDAATFDPREASPALHDLVNADAGLKTLADQLMKPQLVQKMTEFPTWKVKEYPEYYKAFKAKREGPFAPKIIQLRE